MSLTHTALEFSEQKSYNSVVFILNFIPLLYADLHVDAIIRAFIFYINT
jgi:hypothetical protein